MEISLKNFLFLVGAVVVALVIFQQLQEWIKQQAALNAPQKVCRRFASGQEDNLASLTRDGTKSVKISYDADNGEQLIV